MNSKRVTNKLENTGKLTSLHDAARPPLESMLMKLAAHVISALK